MPGRSQRTTPRRRNNPIIPQSQLGAASTETNGSLGYEAVFDPEIENKYVCPVCLAAMRDPVQTKCGHRFCRPCLKRSTG